MKQNLKNHLLSGLILTCAGFLSSCGGGSGSSVSGAGVSAVKVFGDSLVDVGTFKDVKGNSEFSVQAADTAPNTVWVSRIAAAYGLKAATGSGSLCNFYTATATSFTTNRACTVYGIGGGRVNNATNPDSKFAGEDKPFSITTQMATVAAAGYTSSDLVLIDGGGNDMADLVVAFITDNGKGFPTALGTLLPASTFMPMLASQNFAGAGTAYMQALATKLTTSIQSNVLAKGATKVAVLNIPAILNTPRFQMVMQGVQAQAGAAAAAQYKAIFVAWMKAYNTQLQSNLGGDSRVLIVDFYTNFDNQVNSPAQYGLTNVTTPVCPVTGVDKDTGLPDYTFSTCTAAALSAQQPSNPNWWKTYAFSDGFHPTPYGYQLLAQVVSLGLVQKGWM